MPELIHVIVRQLQLLEADDLTHPLVSRARRVGVDVESTGHLGLGFARYDPFGVVIFVAIFVRGDDVHDENVFQLRIEPRDSDFKRGKHSSKFGKVNRN